MESRLVDRASRSGWVTYSVAVTAAVGGLLIRLPLAAVLGEKVPYITFFLATAVSATFGGQGPGLVTTVLGALFASWFVMRDGTLLSSNPADNLGLVLFLGIGGFISVLAGRLLDARSHENALRLLFEQTLVSIGDAVISTDEEKRVRFMNRVAERLTGWKEAEAKGRPMSEVFRIVAEDSDVPIEDPVEKVLRTGNIVGLANHTELISRNGRRIPIDDSGAPIRDKLGGIAGAVLVFRDITTRRDAERMLLATEQRCRKILESITDAFVLFDHEWRFKDMNEAASKLMRRQPADVMGKVLWEHYPALVGTIVEEEYRRAVAERVAVHFEHFNTGWEQWFELSAYPSDEGLAVYFRDISERKRSESELTRLNDDLQQFTFAATHDLREPLRMVLIYAELLQRDLKGQYGTQADEFISHVVNGAQRISRLIDGLLEYLRTGEIEPAMQAPVDANAALNEALEDLHLSVSEAGGTIVSDPLPEIAIARVHLRQIFQNLVANAVKYNRNGVAPQVHVSAQRKEEMWVFAIRDNGIGIAPQHHGRIFEPFKRLHGSEVSGSGIGLATCKRIVERYGGRIWVESEERLGSTFYFSLPAGNASAALHNDGVF